MFRRKLFNLISNKTLFITVISLLLVAVHTFISISSVHAINPNQKSTTGTSDNRACVQQCSPTTSEPRLASISERDEDDSPTPFQLLLAVTAVTIFVAYKLPTLLKHVHRKLKVPIYKQVASFRI